MFSCRIWGMWRPCPRSRSEWENKDLHEVSCSKDSFTYNNTGDILGQKLLIRHNTNWGSGEKSHMALVSTPEPCLKTAPSPGAHRGVRECGVRALGPQDSHSETLCSLTSVRWMTGETLTISSVPSTELVPIQGAGWSRPSHALDLR